MRLSEVCSGIELRSPIKSSGPQPLLKPTGKAVSTLQTLCLTSHHQQRGNLLIIKVTINSLFLESESYLILTLLIKWHFIVCYLKFENLIIVPLHRKYYKGNEKSMQTFPKYNTTSVPDLRRSTCYKQAITLGFWTLEKEAYFLWRNFYNRDMVLRILRSVMQVCYGMEIHICS